MSEKTFRIPVSTGLFEHYGRIGEAIWLLLLLVDRTTKEINHEGIVSGGAPISDANLARAFNCEVKTVRRWRKKLTDGGYIDATRTPYGFRFRVRKSKKWATSSGQVSPPVDIEVHRELPNGAVRVTDSGSQSYRKGKNKEDSAVDTTRTNQPTTNVHKAVRGWLAGAFSSESNHALSVTAKQIEAVIELAKQHGEPRVKAAFRRFLRRVAGVAGLAWPVAVFLSEFEQHKMSDAERMEERRKRQPLTPADEALLQKLQDEGRAKLANSLHDTKETTT